MVVIVDYVENNLILKNNRNSRKSVANLYFNEITKIYKNNKIEDNQKYKEILNKNIIF